MSVGLPGKHRKTKNHKAIRSAKNRKSGYYERQKARTKKNKAKRIAREAAKAAISRPSAS